jgi:ABC-2 type transport system ATP-binding protein
MTETAAVHAVGLVKAFGDVHAVDGVDLDVGRGEIFGVLGPNGAGKTTMLRMLATLLPVDAGEARVFGVDVAREPHRVRQLIGVTGQYASVDENLTAGENLWLFGRLQGIRSSEAAPWPGACSRSSVSRKPPTGRRRTSPAACAGGSTSRRA